MSDFVKSLRRLYKAGRVTLAKLQAMLQQGKITQEEFDYITA